MHLFCRFSFASDAHHVSCEFMSSTEKEKEIDINVYLHNSVYVHNECAKLDKSTAG